MLKLRTKSKRAILLSCVAALVVVVSPLACSKKKSGGDLDAFCDAASEAQEFMESDDAFESGLVEYAEESQALLEEMQDNAPEEIAEDLDVWVDAMAEIADAEDDEEAEEIFDELDEEGDAEAATDEVVEFVEDECDNENE